MIYDLQIHLTVYLYYDILKFLVYFRTYILRRHTHDNLMIPDENGKFDMTYLVCAITYFILCFSAFL